MICTQKGVTINQMWSQKGWYLNFRRALIDWDVGAQSTLLNLRESLMAYLTAQRLRWKLNSKGAVSVKSAYWKLNQKGIENENVY